MKRFGSLSHTLKGMVVMFLLVTGIFNVLNAQTPSIGQTPNLGLRLYPSNARGIADSVNYNWILVDLFWERNFDSLAVHRAELNSLGSLWQPVGNNIFYNLGDVGIGFPLSYTLTEKLEVNGQIKSNGLIVNNGFFVGLSNSLGRIEFDTDLIESNVNILDADVGIGGSPSYKLDVTGDVYVDTNLYVSNRLGIGTASPAYKLDVDGDINFSDSLRRNGVALNLGNLGDTVTAKLVKSPDDDGLKLYDNAGNGIFVEDGGDVAIGFTTPTELLHVRWDPGVDAGFFRGTTDVDITGVFMRNTAGTLYYLWIGAGGNVTTSTTKP
jgi:hypothetical protein